MLRPVYPWCMLPTTTTPSFFSKKTTPSFSFKQREPAVGEIERDGHERVGNMQRMIDEWSCMWWVLFRLCFLARSIRTSPIKLWHFLSQL